MQLIGIRFRPGDLVQFFQAGDLKVAPGETVVVEGPWEQAVGTVVVAPDQLLDGEAPEVRAGCVRPATDADRARLSDQRETEGARRCRELVGKHPDLDREA